MDVLVDTIVGHSLNDGHGDIGRPWHVVGPAQDGRDWRRSCYMYCKNSLVWDGPKHRKQTSASGYSQDSVKSLRTVRTVRRRIRHRDIVVGTLMDGDVR